MKFNFTLLFITIFLLAECKSLDSEIEADLDHFAEIIKSKDVSKIKKITTNKGLTSLMDWSDSLRNERFITKLGENLKNNNIFNVQKADSVIYLSLGESDQIVGATGGYLRLKRVEGELRIHEYRGGK